MQHIELCCGIGGFRFGLGQGIETVAAIDHSKTAISNYNINHVPPNSSFGDIETADIPLADLLTCGVPCEPCSLGGKKKGMDDDRWKTTIPAVAKAIVESGCKHVIIENVKEFPRFPQAINIILEATEKLKHQRTMFVLKAIDFGMPQKRQRYFIVTSVKGKPNRPTPEKKEKPTIGDIIQRNADDRFPDLNLKLSEKRLEGLRRHRDHHQKAGHGFGFEVLGEKDIFNTFVVGGMGLEKNILNDNGVIRFPTPREVARAQGFPETYKLPPTKTQAYDLLAKAVPPPFISAILEANREAWFE